MLPVTLIIHIVHCSTVIMALQLVFESHIQVLLTTATPCLKLNITVIAPLVNLTVNKPGPNLSSRDSSILANARTA